MLIDFSVENFRSIKEMQTLSLLATNHKEEPAGSVFETAEKKINLLKTAIIYGANASGKSNLVRAIFKLCEFIEHSTDLKIEKPIPYYMPFKLDSTYTKKPTKYEIEFITPNKIRYFYEVSFDSQNVFKEALYFYPNKQKVYLFVREFGKKIEFNKNEMKGPQKRIEEELNDNQLFLSIAGNKKNSSLREVYLYFRNFYQFSLSQIEAFRILPTLLTKKLFDDDFYKNKIMEFMAFTDVGIDAIEIHKKEVELEFPKEMPMDLQEEIKEDLSYKPMTIHKMTDSEEKIAFDLFEESDGTIKLFGLSGKIIAALQNGEVLIIDELNNGLHPLISEQLIKIFSSKETNPNNAQLIITTHDTTLLNPKLFRRDQIWFTEKNKESSTDVYPLSDFDYREVRKDIPFDRWYLSGRFGALPLVKEFLMD